MKDTQELTKIIIVGGGTAGWMTAAAFINRLPKNFCQITLIESSQIGSVGVGESTIPHIRQFNQNLGIDEKTFIQKTDASFKLGIRFRNWRQIGDDYIHPFGGIGPTVDGIEFQHYWARAQQLGLESDFEDFSLLAKAARQGLFSDPSILKQSQFCDYAYSYHLDATKFAHYLKNYAIERGVSHIDAKVIGVEQNDLGDIASIGLDNDTQLSADIFIDCSGFSSILLGKTLNSDFEDWSHWLPTNKAIVAQSELVEHSLPLTTATALPAGWQWQIPIKQRMGNGHVYCDSYMSDDEAANLFRQNIKSKLITEPRLLSFKAGVRPQSWKNNCIGIGLSAGFLEPLESTSIYLIQHSIFKFLEYFPNKQNMQAERQQFNDEISKTYQTIRDFIILHYNLNNRDDNGFWVHQRQMELPESLTFKKGLFAESGRVIPGQFGVWPSVCIGQGLTPQYPDARINYLSKQQLEEFLRQEKQKIAQTLKQLPPAHEYLTKIYQEVSCD